MSRADDDPTIPPEWTLLSELPWWVRRIYSVGSDAIRRELILAVRHHELPHRVQCKSRPGTGRSPSLPPGLNTHFQRFQARVVVTDWESASADWKSSTVGGWKQGDGTRERLPIEVPWKEVADFVTLR